MGGIALLKAGEKIQIGKATWFSVVSVTAERVRSEVEHNGADRILISPSNLIIPHNVQFYLFKGDTVQVGEHIQIYCQVIDPEAGCVGIRYYGPEMEI